MSRGWKYGLWTLIVAGAAAGGWFYLRRDGQDPAEKYRTETISRGAVHSTVTATGRISAVTTVQVGSQVSGIIARLHADFNSPVRRGQLLAELDPTPFEAQVEQRRADLTRSEVQMKSAEIEYRRSERLLSEGLTSTAEFDAAKSAFDAAAAQVDLSRASLRQSETNLKYTKILSPIDGVVVDRQYDVGQTVAASFQAPTLFTIAQDLTKMQVQADVDQADIGRVRVGATARFTVDAYPDEEFEGEISQIRLNATVNQNVITYPVILTVPNPDEKLRPDMTANVTIVVESATDVLRVPNAALRFRPVVAEESGAAPERAAGAGAGAEQAAARVGQGSGLGAAVSAWDAATRAAPGRRRQTIYLLGKNGNLEPTPIRTGITDGRHTAIVEGEVQEGDVVAIGLATSKVESTGSYPGAPTGPRGRR